MSNYGTYSATSDYAVTCEPVEVERLMRVSIEDSEVKLCETFATLQSIITSLINTPQPENKHVEPKCLRESAESVNLLAEACLGMSKRIQQILFN